MSSGSKTVKTRRRPKYPSVAFVGAGALATGMARSLHAVGYTIREFVLRGSGKIKPSHRVKALARAVNARTTGFEDCELDADVIWIAVPDDRIGNCAQELARLKPVKGKIVLHSSGALTSNELLPLRRKGAATASLHPMMSFSTANRHPNLRGVWFSVEGDSAAVQVAQRIVQDLRGNLMRLDESDKALYHATGAMIAPLMVSHLECAETLAKRVGLSAKKSRAVMKPILEKVVAAFLEGGTVRAFSGPFLRGDVSTVERHLRALKDSDEEPVYRALAEYAVEHLHGENKQKLRKVLAKS